MNRAVVTTFFCQSAPDVVLREIGAEGLYLSYYPFAPMREVPQVGHYHKK